MVYNRKQLKQRQSESSGDFDVPLFMTYNGATYYYITDGNKNIIALLDNSETHVADYTYSPFGQTLTATGTMAQINPFRFSSEFHDSETGLIYYNYRYYSPELGRWTKRDPIEEEGGLNLYGFVRNNFIVVMDRNGLFEYAQIDLEKDNYSCCSQKQIFQIKNAVSVAQQVLKTVERITLQAIRSRNYQMLHNDSVFPDLTQELLQKEIIPANLGLIELVHQATFYCCSWCAGEKKAFVFRDILFVDTTVFLCPEIFTLSTIEFARYIIHEWTHLFLMTKDNFYEVDSKTWKDRRGEDRTGNHSIDKRLNNADSFSWYFIFLSGVEY